MLTEKQLLANQRNALKSTGPRTAEGKAIASQNAVRHGLRADLSVIPGEDPEEFDQFRQLLLDDLAPAGALELCLADRIVASFWKLRRAGRIETDLLSELNRNAVQDDEKTGGANDLPFKITVTRSYECPVHGKRLDQEHPPDGCDSCPVEADPESPEFDRLKPSPLPGRQRSAAENAPAAQTVQEPVDHQQPPALGRIFKRDMASSNILARFRLYEGQIERSLYKALTELQKLQVLRSKLWMHAANGIEHTLDVPPTPACPDISNVRANPDPKPLRRGECCSVSDR